MIPACGGLQPVRFSSIGLTEAILRWVEEGKVPDKLMAEKRDSTGKVIRTRTLYPFPQVAKYKGSGSTDNAAKPLASR